MGKENRGVTVLSSLLSQKPGEIDNRYKDINIRTEESAIVWPWEYQTVYEKYTDIDLPKLLELSRFFENGDNPDSKHFTLNSDNYVWDILSGCKDAVFVDDPVWNMDNREYISFTITSETLGVYKVAMYVNSNGYLWTNAFDWQYLFHIGEDAAGKIIKYAKENSVKAEYEPYRNTIVGKIIEITEDYGVIAVGDTVQISYEGEIDEENGNTIDSAISASKADISGGEVLIPE